MRYSSDAKALAVNTNGSIIVGDGNIAAGRSRALRWDNGTPAGLPAPSGYRDSIANDLSDDSGIIVRYLAGSLVGLPETSAIWTAQTTECQRSITFDNKVFPFLRTTAADSKRMFCADGNVYASLIRDN